MERHREQPLLDVLRDLAAQVEKRLCTKLSADTDADPPALLDEVHVVRLARGDGEVNRLLEAAHDDLEPVPGAALVIARGERDPG